MLFSAACTCVLYIFTGRPSVVFALHLWLHSSASTILSWSRIGAYVCFCVKVSLMMSAVASVAFSKCPTRHLVQVELLALGPSAGWAWPGSGWDWALTRALLSCPSATPFCSHTMSLTCPTSVPILREGSQRASGGMYMLLC